MKIFYFDLHSGDNITIDGAGIELAGVEAARRLAVEMLGQNILDSAARHAGWVSKIEVRDQHRLVLQVSAAVIVDDLS